MGTYNPCLHMVYTLVERYSYKDKLVEDRAWPGSLNFDQNMITVFFKSNRALLKDVLVAKKPIHSYLKIKFNLLLSQVSKLLMSEHTCWPCSLGSHVNTLKLHRIRWFDLGCTIQLVPGAQSRANHLPWNINNMSNSSYRSRRRTRNFISLPQTHVSKPLPLVAHRCRPLAANVQFCVNDRAARMLRLNIIRIVNDRMNTDMTGEFVKTVIFLLSWMIFYFYKIVLWKFNIFKNIYRRKCIRSQ